MGFSQPFGENPPKVLSKWSHLKSYCKPPGENNLPGPYLVGDSDLNGTIEAQDLNNLALAWQNDSEFNWTNGNFTIGGGPGVRVNDLNAMAVNWQQSVGAAAAAGQAVPEPAGIVLMLAGLFGLFAVRRR